MITINMVKTGYNTGLISLIPSPNGDGIACSIGDNWFYFGGITAESCSTVDEYKDSVPEEDIIKAIHETLDDFLHEEFEDEYLYYEYYLREHGVCR